MIACRHSLWICGGPCSLSLGDRQAAYLLCAHPQKRHKSGTAHFMSQVFFYMSIRCGIQIEFGLRV